jgi:hypothetical protein
MGGQQAKAKLSEGEVITALRIVEKDFNFISDERKLDCVARH